jgi:hypothetical protein
MSHGYGLKELAATGTFLATPRKTLGLILDELFRGPSGLVGRQLTISPNRKCGTFDFRQGYRQLCGE